MCTMAQLFGCPELLLLITDLSFMIPHTALKFVVVDYDGQMMLVKEVLILVIFPTWWNLADPTSS